MTASFDLLENNRVIINHDRENATPEEPDDRDLSSVSSGGSPGRAAGAGSAVFVPMGLDLPGERDDGVVFRMVLFNAGTGGVDIFLFKHQGDPAGEIALDRPRCGGDPVANVVAVQQVVQCKTLLIVGEKNIPAGDISH